MLCMMQSVERISELLRGARFPVFLTGAGVSTDSGIPDFRSPGTGIWEKVNPMEVAKISAFREDPGRFWSFYSKRMGMLSSAKLNPAHIALARLEGGGYVKGLITQNIDRLHSLAGSQLVAEVHGSIDHAECLECGSSHSYDRVTEMLAAGASIPLCDCGAALKPGVVVGAGSSPGVYPVAGLPELTRSAGGVLINIEVFLAPYDEVSEIVS